MAKKYDELNDNDYTENSANVDGEEFNYYTAESEANEQLFQDLSDDDKSFIEACLELADNIIQTFYPNNSIENYTLDLLDNIIDEWNNGNIETELTENEFVNSIGVAFGQKLVDLHGMKWTIVTDEYGTDYAITIREIKLTNFPLSSVLKAVEDQRTGSLAAINLLTKKQIAELRSDS